MFYIMEASRGAGEQSVTVNRLVVGLIPTRGNEIFILIYISIFFTLVSRHCAALSSAIQHVMLRKLR